ncbi:hypothetical protein DPMN_176968 [Dreissena polymorpha]|uniref:Uncharacterized protein n=1 Tax=Dreissena polymorpha TaxID=45954 RepID=A0A9D4IL56_DREPO|nr:hypothetical protein DPMN_176968 [Dreissena polymorpha]
MNHSDVLYQAVMGQAISLASTSPTEVLQVAPWPTSIDCSATCLRALRELLTLLQH